MQIDKALAKNYAVILKLLDEDPSLAEKLSSKNMTFLTHYGLFNELRGVATKAGKEFLSKYLPVRSNPRKKLSREKQKRVSKKIQKLIREGYPVKQAAAISYKYARSNKLGPRGGKKKNPADNVLPFARNFSDDEYEVTKWFERDRAHVALENRTTNETVVEWWDEQVFEAVEDGTLNVKNYGTKKQNDEAFDKSVIKYALECGLLSKLKRPAKNPAGATYNHEFTKDFAFPFKAVGILAKQFGGTIKAASPELIDVRFPKERDASLFAGSAKYLQFVKKLGFHDYDWGETGVILKLKNGHK